MSSVPDDDARELEVVNESEPKVVDEPDPKPEVEEQLIETLVNLPTELTMKLLLSLPAQRVLLSLRPPDVYDLLQIFLNDAVSQKFGVLIYGSIFSGTNLSCFDAYILLELPLIVTGWLRKSVPPPPPWFRHDTSVLIPKSPPWPD